MADAREKRRQATEATTEPAQLVAVGRRKRWLRSPYLCLYERATVLLLLPPLRKLATTGCSVCLQLQFQLFLRCKFRPVSDPEVFDVLSDPVSSTCFHADFGLRFIHLLWMFQLD